LQLESSQMAPLWEALCAAYDQHGGEKFLYGFNPSSGPASRCRVS